MKYNFIAFETCEVIICMYFSSEYGARRICVIKHMMIEVDILIRVLQRANERGISL